MFKTGYVKKKVYPKIYFDCENMFFLFYAPFYFF